MAIAPYWRITDLKTFKKAFVRMIKSNDCLVSLFIDCVCVVSGPGVPYVAVYSTYDRQSEYPAVCVCVV